MTDRATVVYGFDPLCGWCFAFGPAFAEARAALAGEVDFVPACGGLVTGERVRPVGADADYLRAGLLTVEERTGVRAGPAFLDGLLADGRYVSDSEPPCRAVRVALDLAGAGPALDLGHALTRAYYVDGLPPDSPDTLRRASDEVGLDGEELVRRWQEPAAAVATAEWFVESRAAGVRVYPSLFLSGPDGLVPLTEGAVTARTAVDTIRAAIV